MKRTSPASSPAPRAQHARGAGEHRGVGVVPAGVHPPGDRRGEVEPGLLGHRQRVHVAAQQHACGRACAPLSIATAPVHDGPSRHSSGRSASSARTLASVSGVSSPSSGSAWIARRSATMRGASSCAWSRRCAASIRLPNPQSARVPAPEMRAPRLQCCGAIPSFDRGRFSPRPSAGRIADAVFGGARTQLWPGCDTVWILYENRSISVSAGV